MLTIEEIRTETEERAENIDFTANKHQYKKQKATLYQACVIIATNEDIGSRNAETEKQQH